MIVEAMVINAFTDSLSGGNPAGLVLKPPKLTDDQMAFISRKLNVSETAFVFPSKKADYKIRFFTPSTEVDLCGHATIATFFTMAQLDLLPKKKNLTVTQETKAGILQVDIFYNNKIVEKVMMTQAEPIYKDIYLDISLIADSLKIPKNEIDETFPNQIVSTGLFTLPICVKSFDTLKYIKPDFEKIKKICNQINAGSYHVFTFDAIEKDSVYHARNFAPVYSVNEDPVTGTANGAVCAYLKNLGKIKGNKFICEQGDIIGRKGRVFVDIIGDVVRVGGKARIVKELKIELVK